MFVLRFLLVFSFFLGCSHKTSTQPLTPKIDHLVEKITLLNYNHNFEEAQTLVLEYLKQEDLSPVEVFYGHFLRADINKLVGSTDKAIDLLLESQKYLAPIEDKAIFESLIYGNISECYFNMHEHATAKKYALLSIESSPDKSLRGSSHAVNNIIIGFNYSKEKDYVAALHFYQEAIQQYQLAGDWCELPLCYNKIAAVYWKQHKYDLAEQSIDQSLIISDSCNIDQYRLLTHLTQFKYYKYREDYKNALASYKRISFLRAKINSIEQKATLNHLEANYEIELAQNENRNLIGKAKLEAEDTQIKMTFLITSIFALLALLNLFFFMLRGRKEKNKLLSKQLQKIELQNKEREALLKEIHHRVKNNLQVITSLLHLQAHQNDDQNIQDLFKKSQYRINTMAMVHEMLYQSDNLSKIQLKPYLEELTKSLIRSIKEDPQTISTHFEIPETINLGLDTAIPLGLITNEIITNALIHGIPNEKKGKIYIRIEVLKAASFILYIGDNGLGYSEDLSSKKGHTLGLMLVQKLTRQLSGTLQEDTTQKGCHYRITFQEIE